MLKSDHYLAAEVMRGFKLTAANANKKIVRGRILAYLAHDPEMCALMLRLEGMPWIPWVLALEAIDEFWLLDNWAHLMRSTRDRNLMAAMAVDHRDSIACLGERLLARPSLWRDDWKLKDKPPPPFSWEALAELASLTSPGHTLPDQTPTPGTDAKRAKAEAKQKALESEVKKLKTALDKQKQRTAAEAEERTLTEHKKQVETRKLRDDLKKTRDQLDPLRADFAEKLEARIQQYRRETLGMTEHKQQIEEKLRSHETGDLLEQIQQVLETHRRLNEKYGTLSELRQQINTLENADTRLRECAAESIHVLPELHEVQRNVAKRLSQLRALMPGESSIPDARGYVKRTLKMIRNCTLANDGLGRLAGMTALVENPAFTELVGDENLQLIKTALKQQKEHLQQIEKEQTLAQMDVPAKSQESGAIPFPHEVWDVDDELDRLPEGKKPVVYVDGYNVINGAEPLAATLQTKGLSAARTQLNALCDRIKSAFERIEIVYDGTDALNERETHGNIVEVFAARLEESQNADNYITDSLHSGSRDNGVLWLVTADGGLRARNRAVCHGLIDPQDFVDFLEAGP